MSIPDQLWHYTDAAGLQGILKSGVLRLSDVRFMNDSTERTYGLRAVDSFLEEMVARKTLSPKAVDPKYTGYKIAGERVYVCSFSERSDSLSQWQRYAADGYGYCIAFNSERLLSLGVTEPGRLRVPPRARCSGTLEPPALQRMIYERDAQAERTRSCVTYILSHVQPLEKAAPYLSLALEEIAAEFKNPLFEDEHEWRLVQRGHHDTIHLVKFATQGPYSKPYLESRLAEHESKHCLPVSSVICGPRLDQELATEAVRELLAASGYSIYEVSVIASALRGAWR